MRGGDRLVVWKPDRLARSSRQLLETVEDLERRGIGLEILTQNVDTASAGGCLILAVFGAIAEFEREIIRERTRAGLDAARSRGRMGGRPRAISDKDLKQARALIADPEITVEGVADALASARPACTGTCRPRGTRRRHPKPDRPPRKGFRGKLVRDLCRPPRQWRSAPPEQLSLEPQGTVTADSALSPRCGNQRQPLQLGRQAARDTTAASCCRSFRPESVRLNDGRPLNAAARPHSALRRSRSSGLPLSGSGNSTRRPPQGAGRDPGITFRGPFHPSFRPLGTHFLPLRRSNCRCGYRPAALAEADPPSTRSQVIRF